MAVVDTVDLVHLVLAHAVVEHLVVGVQHHHHLKGGAVSVELREVDKVAVVDGHSLDLLSIDSLFQLYVSVSCITFLKKN